MSCILLIFLKKRFSFTSSPPVLWFFGDAAVERFELTFSSSLMIVDMEELLINVSSVKYSMSSRGLLVDLRADVSSVF